jgi:hypothetical protein
MTNAKPLPYAIAVPCDRREIGEGRMFTIALELWMTVVALKLIYP